MAGQRYFFSYARDDSQFVLRLAKELRAAGANLWLDQLDIVGGQHWDQAVEDALRASAGMIVVLSPSAVSSDNVMDEVSYALEQKKRVVPLLYRACDVPFRLRRVQFIDFTEDYDRGFRQLLRALSIGEPLQPQERDTRMEPVTPEMIQPAEHDRRSSRRTWRTGCAIAIVLNLIFLAGFFVLGLTEDPVARWIGAAIVWVIGGGLGIYLVRKRSRARP